MGKGMGRKGGRLSREFLSYFRFYLWSLRGVVVSRAIGIFGIKSCEFNNWLTLEFSSSPHTLNAKELYQAHLTPYLEKAQVTLDSKLEQTQSENAELADKIQDQRQEIEKLLSSLEGVVGDLEGAVGATTEFDAEGNLRKEVVQMDEAVKSVQQP